MVTTFDRAGFARERGGKSESVLFRVCYIQLLPKNVAERVGRAMSNEPKTEIKVLENNAVEPLGLNRYEKLKICRYASMKRSFLDRNTATEEEEECQIIGVEHFDNNHQSGAAGNVSDTASTAGSHSSFLSHHTTSTTHSHHSLASDGAGTVAEIRSEGSGGGGGRLTAEKSSHSGEPAWRTPDWEGEREGEREGGREGERREGERERGREGLWLHDYKCGCSLLFKYIIGEASLGGGGIGESVVSSIDTEGLDALRFRNNFLQVYI